MMIDQLENADRYACLHACFSTAFAFLRAHVGETLPPGRTELEGRALYVISEHKEGRGREGARLETHRRYIDIQLTCEGDECIGWSPRSACAASGQGYDEAKDIECYASSPAVWLPMPPARFGIFFPEDAHAPLAGTGALRKLIAKVAVG